MRLLLDECVPRKLKGDLVGHEVATVVEAGYGGMKNGVLLRAAAGNYDVLITVDQNLPRQQNIRSLEIAVLVLVAAGIKYDDTKALIPQLMAALKTIKPGEFVRLEKAKT
ncbi:MAG: DUF5615 family PIN-like protein [Pyrinomonadaceae bacterium]